MENPTCSLHDFIGKNLCFSWPEHYCELNAFDRIATVNESVWLLRYNTVTPIACTIYSNDIKIITDDLAGYSLLKSAKIIKIGDLCNGWSGLCNVNLGYLVIQFQTGTGKYKEHLHETLKIEYHPYFENFVEEISKADLVISHAGAGTCIQVLEKGIPLIVVVNEDLMDNHQIELAEQLSNDGYLYSCTCSSLDTTLLKDLKRLKPYPRPPPNIFSNFLDKCMGFID